MIRLFVSLPLPPEALAQVESLSESLERQLGPLAPSVRAPRAEGVHFTLKFLGETPEGLLQPIRRELGTLSEFMPFPLTLAGLSGFPSLEHPRVVTLGVVEGSEPLVRLAACIEAALVPLGFLVERRPFMPHLTLLRVSHPRDASAIGHHLARTAPPPGFTFLADRIELVQSQLAPGGSLYTPLATFPLQAPLHRSV